MEKLISMIEFVLSYKYNNKVPIYNQQSDRLRAIVNYANLLNKPLELGMFVPCDEYGNILEEPNRWKDYLEYPESFDGNKEWEELYSYEEAQKRVLFKDFDIKYKNCKEFKYQSEEIIFTNESYCIVYNCYYKEFTLFSEGEMQFKSISIVQDLVEMKLTLTYSDLKQIGI